MNVINPDELRLKTPALFAETPHVNRTEKYGFVKTIDILNAAEQNGFSIIGSVQARSRDPERLRTAKHMVFLRETNQEMEFGGFFEISLMNSHNGSSSLVFLPAFYNPNTKTRMFAGGIGRMRIVHRAGTVEGAVEAINSITESFPEILLNIQRMSVVDLTQEQRNEFAAAAAKIRFGDKPVPYDPSILLERLDFNDDGFNMWTVLSRVQYNLTQGGQTYTLTGKRTKRGHIRQSRTRKLTNIHARTKADISLWNMAMEYVVKAEEV